ncbi:hypothetical protein ACHAXS_005954 [Conticribra weissflogii]
MMDEQFYEHMAAPVVHPTTGETISNYWKLAKDPELKKIWTKAFRKELGNLAQRDELTNTSSTDTIFFMNHDKKQPIPKDRIITYACIVVDFRPQKDDLNRVRITASGNLINYPGELTTKTDDLTTAKMMWNSVVSTPSAKYACFDVKKFYLGTPMDWYKYMKMPIALIPEHFIQQYKLHEKVKNRYIYMEIQRGIWGLLQAGILANKLLKKRLQPHGYYKVPNTPGLFKHATKPIQFTLVVDDFRVKYISLEHAQHLFNTLKQYYTILEDWEGKLYCRVSLNWNYEQQCIDILMPGYIAKVLQTYNHDAPPAHNTHHIQHLPKNMEKKHRNPFTLIHQTPSRKLELQKYNQ